MQITELLDGIQLPDGVRCPPSWSRKNRKYLVTEVDLLWLIDDQLEPPWVREVFLLPGTQEFDSSALVGYTLDSQGHLVRAWLVSDRNLNAYLELQRQGCGTCPLDAVLPWTLHPGLPSLPAHLCGGSHPGHRAEHVLILWAMLAACLDGEKQGLRVGLRELCQKGQSASGQQLRH